MSITFNGLTPPITNLEMGVFVQCDTTEVGTAYYWQILDKPDGSSASLSSSTAKDPTFTPDVTGSYLIGLTTDNDTYTAVARLVHVSNSATVPAAGEQKEDGSRAWASPANEFLRRVQRWVSRGEVILVQNASGGNLVRGDVCVVVGRERIYSTRLEEEAVPTVEKANGNSASQVGFVGIMEYATNGGSQCADGAHLYLRRSGVFSGLSSLAYDASSFSVGQTLYVSSNAGELSNNPGGADWYQIFGEVIDNSSTVGAILVDPRPYNTLPSIQESVEISTTPVTLTTGDSTRQRYLFDSTSANIAATLNNPSGPANGLVLYLKNVASANEVEVTPSSASIDGAPSITIGPREAYILLWDANAGLWHILSSEKYAPVRIHLAQNQSLTHPAPSALPLSQFSFDPNEYGFNDSFYFEGTIYVSGATAGSGLTCTIDLYNVTDAEFVTGASLASTSTNPSTLVSSVLTVGASAGNLKNSSKVYEVRLEMSGGADPTDNVYLGTSFLKVN